MKKARENEKTNQVIVKLEDNNKIENIIKDSKYKVKLLTYLENINAYLLECENIEECEELLINLNSADSVSYAEMNYIRNE